MRKYITAPNILTLIRILCAIGLVFAEATGKAFLVLYLICGFTDAIDGTVARLTKTASEFGAKLDSVADLMFYSIMILKFFPILLKTVSGNVWIAVILIVLIRVGIYLGFALKYHALASSHTYLNKITGFVVFCLPFVVNTRIFDSYSAFVCIVAFSAAIYEWVITFGPKKQMTK